LKVFTRGFDRWWPKKLPADPRATQRNGASSAVKESLIEPFAGGRWYSRCEDGYEVTIGHVLVWSRDAGLVSWEFNAQWQPDAGAASEVEVNFIAKVRTRRGFALEHRNFERMGQAGGERMRRMSKAAGRHGWKCTPRKPPDSRADAGEPAAHFFRGAVSARWSSHAAMLLTVSP